MFEARLDEVGVRLPGPFLPHDPLDAVVIHDGTARTSGCLPRDVEGHFPVGLVGRDLTTADGAAAAECCAWNAVSVLRDALGSLDRIERVLTVSVFIACVDGFAEQPTVADGASRALVRLFGEAGRHSRSAIGVAALPRKAPVEIEVTVALRRDG
jgi:enamine deaminase RidA (YjgF/YER057c/UK114 family)